MHIKKGFAKYESFITQDYVSVWEYIGMLW